MLFLHGAACPNYKPSPSLVSFYLSHRFPFYLLLTGHMLTGLCPFWFCSPYGGISFSIHNPLVSFLLKPLPRVSTSSCSRSCSYINLNLSTYHWDSDCRRTWSTTTIQSPYQKFISNQEGHDWSRMEWFPPSIISKKYRAFRLGLESPAGTSIIRTG